MSDNINDMTFKQLRNEVQLLRDELAIMKRKYEDIIYNLDTDNFSSRFVKEQGNMRTAIEVNAEGIKTKVSNEELKNYSTTEQTASLIKNTVTSEYVDDLLGDTYVTKSVFEQRSNEIYAEVSENYDDLSGSISSVSVKANNISTKVGKMENGKFGDYTLFTQTSDQFVFEGGSVLFGEYISLADNDGEKAFNIFHDESGFGLPTIIMWGTNSHSSDPIVLGSGAATVHIGQPTELCQIATREWVRENAGTGGKVVAVFG